MISQLVKTHNLAAFRGESNNVLLCLTSVGELSFMRYEIYL